MSTSLSGLASMFTSILMFMSMSMFMFMIMFMFMFKCEFCTLQSAAYLRRGRFSSPHSDTRPATLLPPPHCWGWGRYTGYSTVTLLGPPPPRLPLWGRRRAGCSGYLPADPFLPPQLTMRPHVGQRGSRRWSVRVEILKPSTTASRPSCRIHGAI